MTIRLRPAGMNQGGAEPWLRAGVGLLVLVSVAASVTYFLREPANLGFLDHPTIVGLHVVLGAVYIMVAPFQFVERIRSRHLSYHRAAGRILVVVGLAVGVTALFLGLVIPFSGWPEAVLIAVFGSLFLFFLSRGYVHIRAKRVTLHQASMTRAFAIALAPATQRVLFIPPLLVLQDPRLDQVVLLSVAAWATALVVHSVLAEVWIRRTRRPRAERSSEGVHEALSAPAPEFPRSTGSRRQLSRSLRLARPDT
jgi:uncharacterized membrane protein